MYKRAKHLSRKLSELPNSCTVLNSTQVAYDVMINSNNEYHRFVTSSVKDLYVNLPITEITYTTSIFQTIRGIAYNVAKQCITLFQTILNQNYYCYDYQYYKPNKGVALGCRISSIVAEIFRQ
jgi:hypothetical protein